MNALPTAAKEQPTNPNPETTPISLADRLVLWMFLLGFVLFGLILIGDLFSGLLR
jgi:hypothetical protein